MKLDIFLKKRQPLKTIKIKKTQEKRKKNTIKDKIIFLKKPRTEPTQKQKVKNNFEGQLGV